MGERNQSKGETGFLRAVAVISMDLELVVFSTGRLVTDELCSSQNKIFQVFAPPSFKKPCSHAGNCVVAIDAQAIDKLEAMLNGGMERQGKTSMFGPKEYVTIYT